MNKELFKSIPGNLIAETDTINNAGGVAYSLSDKAALAQLVVCGTYNSTYYVSDKDQLTKTLELANKVSPTFIAKLAVYAREHALMKDSPAVLTAILASKNTKLFAKVFPKTINDPKMFRNFIKIIRSGVTGRKSFGSRPKKLLQAFLENMTDEQLLFAKIGDDPSLRDCLRMVRPHPATSARSALYAYILDKEYKEEDLFDLAKQFENFKKNLSGEIPKVPFQMLTALPLTEDHWKVIARNMTWNQTRMNLNTLARHGVFKDEELTKFICNKLSSRELVERAKVFPYQLFAAYLNTEELPNSVRIALQKATDYSINNVPSFNGKVYVMVDTSGSMQGHVTGYRGSATTKMRCVDVAALFAAAILRKNPEAEVIPFDTRVHHANINPLDSIMTNAKKFSEYGGGGTDCSCALHCINNRKAKGDLVIYISDNESWMDSNRPNFYSYNRGTAMACEWETFKKRNPSAKLVCLDICPNTTTQVKSRNDVLNLGGFNDTVFEIIFKFVDMGSDDDLWVRTIESLDL
jgi:60 kDa SS-A/Ro ribonucleoprotein